MGELWNRLSEGQKKIFGWLAVALIVGVGALMLQPSLTHEVPTGIQQQAPVEITTSLSSLQGDLETDLTAMLNMMLGGRYSQVLLTMESGPKLSIAYNLTEEERYTQEGASEWRSTSTPVIMRNDAERKEVPLVLEQTEPLVRGVLVVVDRPPQPDLKLTIAQAVATVLQVPMYRIEVLFKQ